MQNNGQLINRKVLIVDDDKTLLEALKLAVEMEGCVVYTLDNGEELENSVQRIKPDLILMDVLLSGTDGRDLVYKLKHTPETRNIPVLMLSASPTTDRSARDFGADDFLAKPFELSDLYSKIEQYLS